MLPSDFLAASIEVTETSSTYYDFWTAILPITIITFNILAVLAVIFAVFYLFKRLNKIIKNQEKLIHLLQETKRNP
ncbi:hypothetical protein SAMN05421743_10934 [Thalassobacillus cyri]|uniref:Uncharacterized protein n=1 Tax=Thalassobacillus cyri TaxID=571932 RepID=A0A1H4EHA1_9BACI|nr:hypothetical protein [Thalassobacillus cyri]SEA83612.1 hypothetical protein SAMN05421743_10934 [Thalassobacillus cyri]